MKAHTLALIVVKILIARGSGNKIVADSRKELQKNTHIYSSRNLLYYYYKYIVCVLLILYICNLKI